MTFATTNYSAKSLEPHLKLSKATGKGLIGNDPWNMKNKTKRLAGVEFVHRVLGSHRS